MSRPSFIMEGTTRDGRPIYGALTRRGSPEEKEFDRWFWREQGHEGRFAAACEMVDMVDHIRGREVGDYRLQRSVQTLQRRSR
jgi:hypothetical protein